MGGGAETTGSALTDDPVGGAIESQEDVPAQGGAQDACLNCGAALTGKYCGACGQPARIHRSLLSLGHDILHGVLHLEGRIWRTLPELCFHPGRLTRRYIDGERVKFVSPMALFLFAVFLMFAVFSLIGGAANGTADVPGEGEMNLMSMGAGSGGDLPKVALGWPTLDNRLNDGLRQLGENPRLVLYRLKSNGYKFSWAIIPMSLPFMWLLFFRRRDIRLYDHAVFVTYSISFVMLLLILLAILAAAGVSEDLWEAAMVLVPPIHLYRQLRGAYGVSRAGALVRLFLLLISIGIVLFTFTLLLLLFGALD